MTHESIAVGFARRQTPMSSFSHFEGSFDALVGLVRTHFGEAIAVNPEKTILRVPVPVDGFFSSVRPLQPGDVVSATFVPRAPGEDPVLQLVCEGQKVPARHVEIILYHRDVLGADASTDAVWEVVSINASPTNGPFPMDPTTMARNQLVRNGGTFQRMYSPEEWADAAWFWATHANVKPR